MEESPNDFSPAALLTLKGVLYYMTGAMYAAVSGLKTHMSALNVIGNNVANVNTNAYKAKRYTFAEALYTDVHSGSNGTEVLGGRNPAQIGYGASVATVDIDMSTKTYMPTGKLLDCMIDGDGFLIVGDKIPNLEHPDADVSTVAELQSMNLTRHCDLSFVNGYLVDGQGQVVYGFLNRDTAIENPDEGQAITSTETIPALTAMHLPMVYTDEETGEKVYVFPNAPDYNPDEEGGEAARIDGWIGFNQEGAQVEVTEENLANAEYVVLQNISVEDNGRIVGTGDGRQFVIGYLALAQVDNPNGVSHVDGRYYQALGGAGEIHLCTVSGNNEIIGLDGPIEVEGAGKTTFLNGGLEMSGTDLATEISNMIIVQRGYQANTRIVTVTDSMLEELINMKRG